MDWHTRDAEALLRALKTSRTEGLSLGQVATLRERFGYNVLGRAATFSVIHAMRKQLTAPLSLVLVAALVVTLVLREFAEALVIVIALGINVIVGTLQEGKAARVFEALSNAAVTKATVLRGGVRRVVDSADLVPGDIVYLESGHTVPADLRLLSAEGLEVNESALTGEWVTVHKNSRRLTNPEALLSAQVNMVFMGTTVASGAGIGVVVATGADAQFGQIAAATMSSGDERTPLQESITSLAHTIVAIIGLIIAFIFVLGVLHGEAVSDMLLVAVAVAVAAMPEGLPAAVTVTLALAMEHVLRSGGLVKRLLAAETLGSTTVILTDKTGTLTEGVMQLQGIYTATHDTAAASPREAEGDTLAVLKMAVLASDAFVEGHDEEGNLIIHGRPLEQAIIEGGRAAGLQQDLLFTHHHGRVAFVPFDASRRYAISLNEQPEGGYILYLSGSPEHLLSHCAKYLEDGRALMLTEEIRNQFKTLQDTLSATGARFTAVAYRGSREKVVPSDVRDPDEGENLNFTFGGLIAFSDTIRTDVKEALSTAQGAGIRVLMVTGDHKETARSVAREVGLASEYILTGDEVEHMTDDALVCATHEGAIFARMLPAQKLRLVTVLKASGEVVAMTGDGVNDAPALTAASIGLAVDGGTDIAKEAADIILLKSSFAVIVTAVQQGRRALANLRKIIAYLLSTSASEIVLIGGAVVIGAPLPLLPAQILWANIVEEGFMSFPFAFEPSDAKAMESKPTTFAERRNVLSDGFGAMILSVSLITGFVLFGLYALLLYFGVPEDEMRTFMFVAVSIDSIFLAFSFKNLHVPLWREQFLSNMYLIAGLVISVLLLTLSLTWSPLVTLLSLVPLSGFEVSLLALLAMVNIAVVEVAKAYFVRSR